MSNAQVIPGPNPRHTVLATAMLAIAALPWIAIVFVALLIMPKFEEIYADFGVALSPMSRTIVAASQALRGAGQAFPMVWPALVVLLLAFAGAWMMVQQPRMRAQGFALVLLLIVAPVILGIVLVVGMYIPMVEMIESMQASRP
jgi:hypothetical protein